MRSNALLLLLLFPCLTAISQNPATIFTIPERNITLPCGTTCTTISATIPHIKQTNDYVVTPMAYLPFAYATPTGTEVTALYTDDVFSSKIPIGFPFCFYGITYPTLLMGSNSNITFDTTRAGSGSGYSISQTTGSIPNTAYAMASIFGPYHDINPSTVNNPAPTNRKYEYRVEGTAPQRRFIASYYDVAYFGDSCKTNKATHEMVLYESTGVIEVYIKDKPFCTQWNHGLAILGVQDETRTKAVAAPGKNATVWGSAGMNEAYRFTPNGGTPKFKRAELLLNGTLVGMGDTASGTPGLLNLSFPSICPTADSSAYVLRVTYGSCSDPANDVVFTDTVRVKRPTPIVDVVKQDASCVTGGSLTANVTTGATGVQYILNGGTPQSSNTFTNLPAGNYTLSIQTGVCAVNTQAVISLQNNLTVNALPSDTSLCLGAGFTPRVTSNSATAYSWTPSSVVDQPTIMQPRLTPSAKTQYIITASKGPCTATDTINVITFSGPQANAGPDLNVIIGDVIQLQAQGDASNTYLWTPSTGLSATNILRPTAGPTQTTTYTLKQITPQGCTSTDDVTVNVLKCVNPMAAFTPNGDGINDRWLVTTSSCLKTARVEVFNRYGAIVYENQDYQNDWDGTYKGKVLPDGTYYYVVTYALINGQLVYEKGNVTILR